MPQREGALRPPTHVCFQDAWVLCVLDTGSHVHGHPCHLGSVHLTCLAWVSVHPTPRLHLAYVHSRCAGCVCLHVHMQHRPWALLSRDLCPYEADSRAYAHPRTHRESEHGAGAGGLDSCPAHSLALAPTPPAVEMQPALGWGNTQEHVRAQAGRRIRCHDVADGRWPLVAGRSFLAAHRAASSGVRKPQHNSWGRVEQLRHGCMTAGTEMHPGLQWKNRYSCIARGGGGRLGHSHITLQAGRMQPALGWN